MSDGIQSGSTDYWNEWKECRSSIARFDKASREIRLKGLGIVTGLIGVSGLLYDNVLHSGTVAVAINAVISLLIFLLFRQDRVNEVFLRATVHRATELEANGSPKLTTHISNFAHAVDRAKYGQNLYTLFAAANYLLFVGTLISFSSWGTVAETFKENIVLILIGSGVMVLTREAIHRYHVQTTSWIKQLSENRPPEKNT